MKWYIQGIILSVLLFSGCQTVNEAVREPSYAAGSVLAVPQAITQGVSDGYVDQTGDTVSNPYGR